MAMPPLTDQQIEAAPDAEALVRLLSQSEEKLAPRLRERILQFRPAVIPPLVQLVEDILTGQGEPDESWAGIHAIDLLADLQAAEAIEPILRVLKEIDWGTYEHEQALQALPRLGAAALEPILAAHAAATDPGQLHALEMALANLGVRDERIYQILTEELPRDAEFGAMSLAEYGDPRALPLLSEALDRYEESLDAGLMGNHAVIELEAAIQRLGGELTPEQQEKVQRLVRHDRAKSDQFFSLLNRAVGRMDLETSPVPGARALLSNPQPARAARKIGRNDPCPCGSGKKYKKCCLPREGR